MSLLAAALAVFGVLCVIDLLLTLGVIRRLREHTTLLEGLLQDRGIGQGTLAVGESIGRFTATTVDREPLTPDLLGDDTLVAFFTPTCEPCQEKLPGFVAYARGWPGGRSQVLAVVVGKTDDSSATVDALRSVARVVSEADDDQLSKAFGVSAFPAFLVIDGTGTVHAADLDYARLPVAADT